MKKLSNCKFAVLGAVCLSASLFMSCNNVLTSDSVESVASESNFLTSTRAATVNYIATAGMKGSVSAGTSIVNGSVKINSAQGWLESAYVKWAGITCDSYNVYYKKSSDSSFTKIDSQLVRKYSGYWRADALGLSYGTYTLKVVPVKDGSEFGTASTVSVSVASHDRSGFAFAGGTCPGAYNADGTLKSNAVVLYITEKTKDTVSLDVTTSSKGAKTNAVGLQNILTLFKKGYDSRPLAIRLIGNITDLSTMDNGDIMISGSGDTKRISNGITFEGVGDDAVANGWGLRIKNASFVEVRNIGWMNCDSSEGDDVSLQQSCDYCWVHNNDMFYGEAGGDADQKKGDGALDCKKSTYITFSYNRFYDNGKCNLLGLSEGTTEGLYITYHHNWYDHSDSRHPRVRYYSAHVYNNYYDGNAKYGAGACLGSSVFMDSNYFRNCKYPMMTSMQGTDVYGTGSKRDATNLATFSKEDGGSIKSYNNYMTGTYYYVPYGSSNSRMDTTVDFDCYEVSSKTQTVPSSVKSYAGSNTYNNFDTSSVMYSYTADSPEVAKANVQKFAGRVENGDFSFTFTEADDSSYALNESLKAKLSSYTTSLVAVQGEGAVSTDDSTSDDDSNNSSSDNNESDNTSTTVSSEVNFSSLSSATISSNTTYDSFTVLATSGKTSKISSATVTYDGTKYTKALVFGGAADSVKPTYRAVKFTLNAGETITVVASASTKTLNLSNGSKVVTTQTVKSSGSALTYTASSSGTYYIYSASGTIKIYDLAISK